MLCERSSWRLTPTSPMATSLWETFIFIYASKISAEMEGWLDYHCQNSVDGSDNVR